MMTVRLLTYDGRQYLMPTLLTWMVRRTGGVPADELEAEAVYDGELQEVLPNVYISSLLYFFSSGPVSVQRLLILISFWESSRRTPDEIPAPPCAVRDKLILLYFVSKVTQNSRF